jgi:hypothetical protein
MCCEILRTRCPVLQKSGGPPSQLSVNNGVDGVVNSSRAFKLVRLELNRNPSILDCHPPNDTDNSLTAFLSSILCLFAELEVLDISYCARTGTTPSGTLVPDLIYWYAGNDAVKIGTAIAAAMESFCPPSCLNSILLKGVVKAFPAAADAILDCLCPHIALDKVYLQGSSYLYCS